MSKYTTDTPASPDRSDLDTLRKHYAASPDKIIQSANGELLLKLLPALVNSEPPTHEPGSSLAGPREKWLKVATGDVDRAGDIMIITGVQLDNFYRNPQFLWQHGMTGLPLHTLGRIKDHRIIGDALYMLAEYASEETYAFAEQIHKMDQSGYLPANSIGFNPIECEENAHGGYTFTKWELVEVSKVELPMNPNAIDDERIEHNTSLEDANNWLSQ